MSPNREEAEGELSLARVALAENDLRHAATHLAGAIALAPELPDAHALLSEIAARSPDGGLGLFPVDDDERSHVGTVVAHAHLLAPTDPEQALWLLAQATKFDAMKPWADVLWVRTLDAAHVDAEIGRAHV